MKKITILMSILAVAACGGKKPEPTEPKEPVEEAPAPAPEAEKKMPEPAPAPEAAKPEPPPPPPPKSWHAQASLVPVKGAKIKGTTVTFSQTEGAPVVVGAMGWFDGIKPGKYHLVVHEAADCGANAAKAGKPMASGDLAFAAAKGASTLTVDKADAVSLDGDGSIVGHALALHDDKKGKPGKILACGPIAAGAE